MRGYFAQISNVVAKVQTKDIEFRLPFTTLCSWTNIEVDKVTTGDLSQPSTHDIFANVSHPRPLPHPITLKCGVAARHFRRG